MTDLPALPNLVLASGSPRRRQLLGGLGAVFTVRPVDLDETPYPGEAPRDYVLRLALAKAAAGAARPETAEGRELVLAADTIVVLEDEILGKPRDPGEARATLARLAGREHTVLTGLALYQRGERGDTVRQASTIETSRVRMALMSEEEIAWYVATGEPLDKAGSYGVQGMGALFVEEVFGNYTNVVGLPLPATRRLFAELGYDVREFSRRT